MKPQTVRLVRSTFNIITGCAVLLACVSAAPAQTTGGNPNNPPTSGRTGGAVSHTIRGKIFLPSGNLPEQRIRVVLELNTGGIAGETFSDSVGNFEFRSLPSNSYKVTVPSDNRTYETTQETVELYGNFPRTFMVQVYLKDKGEAIGFRPKEKLLSVADIQEVPKGAKKSYEKGLKLVQEKKTEEAMTHFEQAIKAFPDYLLAINKLGEQYSILNNYPEAQASFERAISVNPKFSLPHINLGIVLVNQKLYAEAIKEFEAGNRLDDSYPMSHLYLGLALMNNDPPDFGRAEKEMTRALDLGGKNLVSVRKYLYNLSVRRGDMVKAAEHLEAYLKDSPNAQDAEEVRQRLANVKKAITQKQGTAKQ
ncbi:MAG: tetratricopeptide repeat protein [Acidobacteria bacterium]|nr:tetratricopeptide repeat protein [Acidobacteriota bacterium]